MSAVEAVYLITGIGVGALIVKLWQDALERPRGAFHDYLVRSIFTTYRRGGLRKW